MSNVYQWLQENQKRIHYMLLLFSAILLLGCIALNQSAGPGFFLFVEIFCVFLLATSILFALSWHQYGRCEYYCRRIRYEYDLLYYRNADKLQRLSADESAVLGHILKDRSPEEIISQLECNRSYLYKCVANIYRKLDIENDDLFDIDWRNTI